MAVKPFEKKDYTQSEAVNQAQQALDAHKGTKPGGYSSHWKDSMDQVMGQIQNRDPFQYDPGKDPMYLQSMQRYQQMGREAMMDTIGQASAMTGGYGNSYAQNVGQQSYHRYLQSLSDQLPRFQQMALDRYRAIGDDLYRKYGMMSDREREDYSRYQTEVNHYNNELDRLQGIYDREQDRDYSRFTDQQAFDYQQYLDEVNRQQQAARDQLEKERLEAAQAYQSERDRIKDAQWQAEFDENRRRYENAMAASAGRGRSGGGHGGGGGSRRTSSGSSGGGAPKVDTKSVIALGYGPISGDTLAGLVDSGKVTAAQKGNKIVFSPAPRKPSPQKPSTYRPRNNRYNLKY